MLTPSEVQLHHQGACRTNLLRVAVPPRLVMLLRLVVPLHLEVPLQKCRCLALVRRNDLRDAARIVFLCHRLRGDSRGIENSRCHDNSTPLKLPMALAVLVPKGAMPCACGGCIRLRLGAHCQPPPPLSAAPWAAPAQL